nr:hypothetical protein [Tanacetum cinerariifolium]
MAWRHHDFSVVDPFPKPSEYNTSNVAKLRDVVISLRRPPLSVLCVAVITVAEFLRLHNFKGCKVSVGALLPPGAARVTHLASPAEQFKEKKKRKAEEKSTDEHVPSPLVNVGVFVTGRDGIQENVAAFVKEGHGDNEGGISSLQTQPSPPRPTDLLETLEKSARDKDLTDSSRMDNSRHYRDMMSNLFTPADFEFFNEGVRNESAFRRS